MRDWLLRREGMRLLGAIRGIRERVGVVRSDGCEEGDLGVQWRNVIRKMKGVCHESKRHVRTCT